MRLQRKTDYYRLCFDLQVILFSERFISIIKYEETVQIMPHEKALQRNISNKYQMIVCLCLLALYIYQTSNDAKYFTYPYQ